MRYIFAMLEICIFHCALTHSHIVSTRKEKKTLVKYDSKQEINGNVSHSNHVDLDIKVIELKVYTIYCYVIIVFILTSYAIFIVERQ